MRMILSIVRLRICVSHHGWAVVVVPQTSLTRCVQIKWSSSQMHETKKPRSFLPPQAGRFIASISKDEVKMWNYQLGC